MSRRRPVIVCLGDSTTAGTPLFKSPIEAPPDGEGDERSQFAYWIRRERPHWTVVNCGVNAERTDQIAARFDRDVVTHAPDAVVILAGVNDVYQGRDPGDITPVLDAMYSRAAASGAAVVAATIVPFNTASENQNARMRRINAWIAARATELGIGFADTRAAVAAADDPDRLAGSPDELHPDIDGYRRMAAVILAAVEGVLNVKA